MLLARYQQVDPRWRSGAISICDAAHVLGLHPALEPHHPPKDFTLLEDLQADGVAATETGETGGGKKQCKGSRKLATARWAATGCRSSRPGTNGGVSTPTPGEAVIIAWTIT